MVFPGGRVDPGDHALAATLPARDDTAARIAAIRETIEEAGLAVAMVPPPSPAMVADTRRRLHDGEPFAAILADTGIALDLDQLHPFARWLPAHAPVRVFDTLFFLARAPGNAALATVDATENVRLVWIGAGEMLTAADAGHATIIYPTRRNLERLAQFATFDRAVADARAYPIHPVVPYVEQRDGVAFLCIREDCGYPVTAEALGDAVRG